MRKLLLFALAFLITKSILAQTNKIRFGGKVGIDIGKLVILPQLSSRSEEYGSSVVASGFVQIPISQKVKLQIEPTYSPHHSTLKFDPYIVAKQIDLTLHRISLPIQFSYDILDNLSVNIGGDIDYNIQLLQKGIFDIGYRTFDITNEINRINSGILGGFTFYVIENIFLDIRYNQMLTNLYKKTDPEDRTEYYIHSFRFSVGFRL